MTFIEGKIMHMQVLWLLKYFIIEENVLHDTFDPGSLLQKNESQSNVYRQKKFQFVYYI